ncbi:MAG: hypothetical protein P4L81_02480 [Candidatus Pacebacteria bacterium]|nr:hypothetical protein [Candidatus Paceibacterota bacterium]
MIDDSWDKIVSRKSARTGYLLAHAADGQLSAWVKLMRHGAPVEPHLMRTLTPLPEGTRLAKVVAFARASHMMPCWPVEERAAATFSRAARKRPCGKGRRDADNRR